MDDVNGQLPLTESTPFIILSLAASPKHGYAILKEVEALSDGRLVLSSRTALRVENSMNDQRKKDNLGEMIGDGQHIHLLLNEDTTFDR